MKARCVLHESSSLLNKILIISRSYVPNLGHSPNAARPRGDEALSKSQLSFPLESIHLDPTTILWTNVAISHRKDDGFLLLFPYLYQSRQHLALYHIRTAEAFSGYHGTIHVAANVYDILHILNDHTRGTLVLRAFRRPATSVWRTKPNLRKKYNNWSYQVISGLPLQDAIREALTLSGSSATRDLQTHFLTYNFPSVTSQYSPAHLSKIQVSLSFMLKRSCIDPRTPYLTRFRHASPLPDHPQPCVLASLIPGHAHSSTWCYAQSANYVGVNFGIRTWL